MDDAFMFHGISAGGIPMNGVQFSHVIEDIQTLNRRALGGELDMTAISAAAYPALAQRYWILSVGSSVGRGYGPLVVAKQPKRPEELSGSRIAVPGLHTTAFLLLRLAVPRFDPVELPFADIPQAVLEDRVEAGLVIHEWQLTYRDAGLAPVLDLGGFWQRRTSLPLPLGLNVAKKSLGLGRARRIAAILRESILYALAHQEEALAAAMRYGRGTDPERARRFIRMYVNEDSLALSAPCRSALRRLFREARGAGLIPSAPRLAVIEPSST